MVKLRWRNTAVKLLDEQLPFHMFLGTLQRANSQNISGQISPNARWEWITMM